MTARPYESLNWWLAERRIERLYDALAYSDAASLPEFGDIAMRRHIDLTRAHLIRADSTTNIRVISAPVVHLDTGRCSFWAHLTAEEMTTLARAILTEILEND